MIRVWAATAALSMALAACGGGGDTDPTATAAPADGEATPRAATATPAATEDPTPVGTVVSAELALGSAAALVTEAQSLRANFIAAAALGPQSSAFSGELLYRAPNATHVDSSYFGRSIELLGYEPRFYVNVPAEGWKSVDVPTFRPTLGQLISLAEKRGFFELTRLVASLEDVQKLPDDEINDVPYARYRADVQLSDIADQLPGGIADPERLAAAEPYIKSLQFNFWIANDTGLLRRVAFDVDMTGAADDGSSGIEMTIDYQEYNGTVEIPAEPVGAPPLQINDLR